MTMHTVPSSLMGSSLGEAHKWVRSQMVRSNPSKPMADYTLTNENGKKVSLSDLVRGNASHVTINAAGSVRSNPAHPAEIQGFMEVPKPMHVSRLTALTQDEITPALYNAMVNEFGLFGATQTLSILLTRPVSPSLHHTQKTANLIRARKGESLLPQHRFMPKSKHEQKKQEKKDNKNRQRNSRTRKNPSSLETVNAATGLGLGRSVPAAARTLGRAGVLNLDLDKTTTDIRREVDRMLDDAEDRFESGESGALLSVANRMSLKYENSEKLFDNFAKNVLGPYLITSTANINALKYLNEYILPAMREIVGSNSAKKRKLDKQYKHLVEKLATDPKDFYMGTELALIAHPGFLFPRAGLALMPVPESTKDTAFRAFAQIGTPPKWDPKTGFVMVADKSDKSGVAYLDQTTFKKVQDGSFGGIKSVLSAFDAINKLTDVIERYGQTESTGFNVLVRDTRAMAQMSGDQLYRSLSWDDGKRKPAFYFVDLPGIRPIPTNWPQGLIMAMMEILASNRERITGLGSKFDTTEFLTPSGINLSSSVKFGDYANFNAWNKEFKRLQSVPAADINTPGAENANALKHLKSLKDVARSESLPLGVATITGTTIGPTGDDPTATGFARKATGVRRAQVIYKKPGGTVLPDKPYADLAAFLDNHISENKDKTSSGAELNWSLSMSALYGLSEFKTYIDEIAPELSSASLAPITAQKTSVSPSVYQIMVEAVELSMRKYNYNPSKDDVYFATVLLYYSLRNMGLDTKVAGFMGAISGAFSAARKQQMDAFMTQINKDYPIGGATLPLSPTEMQNYLALRFVYEAFNDPTSEGFRQLTGIRTNPSPAVITDSNIAQIKESLKNSLEVFEERMKSTGSNSNAEKVYEAMRDLILPSVIKQMNDNDTEAMFTYVGKEAKPTDKIIEIVNDQFGQCQAAVISHIQELESLCTLLAGNMAITGDLSQELVQYLEAIKGTTAQLELLDNTATAMDDFMKFLPKEVTKAERAYVSKMKDFMTIISDDIQFDKETIGDLIAEVKKHKDDIDSSGTTYDITIPYPILATLIAETKEITDVVTALDATIAPFEKYNATTSDAATRHSNSAKFDMLRPGQPLSHMKKKLHSLYEELLKAVSVMCGSTADTQGVFDNLIAQKQDIPIRRLGKPTEPNPFSAFLKQKDSTQLAQALHKTGELKLDGANIPKDFRLMFEDKPMWGRILLDFYEELAADTGFRNQPSFARNRNVAIEKIVDGLYKKYTIRTKAGNAAKLAAKDTFQLAQAGVEAGKIVGTYGTAAGLKALQAGAGIVGATAGAVGTGLAVGGVLGAQSAINTGRVALEAMNQSTRTVLEGMRTSGIATREKLRQLGVKAQESAKNNIEVMRADAANLRDFVKAKSIVKGTEILEWSKRRMTDARMKTYEALAAYENGTTWGVVESGAVAVGSMLMSFDMARERRRTQKNIDNNIKTINRNIKDIRELKKAYEAIPTQHSGMLKDSVEYLSELLEEMERKGEQQIILLESMDENMPNSVLEDLTRGAHIVKREIDKVADAIIDGVKTGAAIGKAFVQTSGEVIYDLANGAVQTGAAGIKKAGQIGAKGALEGISILVPPVGIAREVIRQQREAETEAEYEAYREAELKRLGLK